MPCTTETERGTTERVASGADAAAPTTGVDVQVRFTSERHGGLAKWYAKRRRRRRKRKRKRRSRECREEPNILDAGALSNYAERHIIPERRKLVAKVEAWLASWSG